MALITVKVQLARQEKLDRLETTITMEHYYADVSLETETLL